MTPDDLYNKTNIQLDEMFAVNIAGWRYTVCSTENPFERNGYRLPNTFAKGVTMTAWWHPTDPSQPGAYIAPPKFTTRVDTVIPWLEKSELFPTIMRPWDAHLKQRAYEITFHSNRKTVKPTLALTLARAMVVAMLLEA